LRAVLPPDETLAEARDRPGCACRSVLSGHNTPLRSTRLLKGVMVFIKPGGTTTEGPCARRTRLTVVRCANQVGYVSKLTVNSGIALTRGKERGRRFIDPHIFR
jgi:hypothetical protein